MITSQAFVLMILMHFLADFGLQTHEQATGKSVSVTQLFYHVGIYSLMWLLGSFILFGDWGTAVVFATITFVAHYATDFVTSRLGKPYWDRKDMHNGFVIVGFDQVLHLLQLYYTIEYLN